LRLAVSHNVVRHLRQAYGSARQNPTVIENFMPGGLNQRSAARQPRGRRLRIDDTGTGRVVVDDDRSAATARSSSWLAHPTPPVGSA
jgi:hypothetical protein